MVTAEKDNANTFKKTKAIEKDGIVTLFIIIIMPFSKGTKPGKTR